MSYNKYYVYKKQYSTDDGTTWTDVVPQETMPKGNPIATYDTLEECESGSPTPSYENQYLTLKANSGSGNVKLTRTRGTFYYTTDNGSTWISATSASTIPLSTEGTMFKGELTPNSTNGVGRFSASTQFTAEGNVMSMLYGDDFVGKTSLSGKNYAFLSLFDYSSITNAENLVLPATTLSIYCYQNMFEGCTSLTTAPELPATTLKERCYYGMFNLCTSLTTPPALPATTLADRCYEYMFNGCTSLTTAPELPATTLTERCYNSMFWGCTSLTTAPVLSAITLADECYSSMFHGCTSLTTAPELPATTLQYYCYSGMFWGCTSLTTAPVLSATTLAEACYGSMFWGCTSLTTAPELPATTLAQACYQFMFYNCTNLTVAPELPATTLTERCYGNMFEGCSGLTTAPQLPATTLEYGCYEFMFRECTNLNYIKCLATNISARDCTTSWVYQVASSGTFVKAASMSGWGNCSKDRIPCGWTVQNET